MAETKPTDTKTSELIEPLKKAYSPPKLIEYGKVTELTGVVGLDKAVDNQTSAAKTAI
jgi:hypothetical protein